MNTQGKSILNTRWDTKTIRVSVKHYFAIRDYLDKEGKSLIYLIVRDKTNKIRLNTEIRIPPSWWNNSKKKLIDGKEEAIRRQTDAFNLILDNINAKLTEIITQYYNSNRPLDAKTLVEEFQTVTPQFDFISFFRHHILAQNVRKNTVKSYNTVLNKLIAVQPEIPFHKIDEHLLARYRKTHSKNAEITYHSDLKVLKKFLKIAKKKNIYFPLDLDDLKINVSGKRIVYLLPEEVQKLIQYFNNEFIQESHILPLGYFLFSCYTGLRISDIQQLSRNQILENTFNFFHVKTGYYQTVKLNIDARKLVLSCENLFVRKLADQKINSHLKIIAERCKISKNLSMHVGRHTFATTFYRNTKDIHGLQKLLGHSNLEQTLTYVHVVKGEELDGFDAVTY